MPRTKTNGRAVPALSAARAVPDGWLTVMKVAIRLGKRYHKARDLMLSGKLGEPRYDGRTLLVPEAGVAAYERREKR